MICYQVLPSLNQRPSPPSWLDLGHLLQQIHMTINAHEIHWGHLVDVLLNQTTKCFQHNWSSCTCENLWDCLPYGHRTTPLDGKSTKVDENWILFRNKRGFQLLSWWFCLRWSDAQTIPDFDKTAYYPNSRLTLLTLLRVIDYLCSGRFGSFAHCWTTCSHGPLKPWLKFVASN